MTADDRISAEPIFRNRGIGREMAVVGAGAVGLTAAADLARQAVDVTVYERGEVAGGASGRAAGVCYDAFTTDPDVTLGAKAFDRFRRFADDGAPFEPCPYVWLVQAGDAEHARAVRDGLERMQELGVGATELDADALADRFPGLRTDDVAVAGATDGAGYTDPGRYTEWLAGRAEEHGATIETNTPVAVATDPPRVIPDGGPEREFDAVLVAAGAHSANLLADAGAPIAMKPYRVQALVGGVSRTSSASGETAVTGPMWYDATADCYARPHPEGLLAGDGTERREADPDGYDREADADFPATLASRVTHRLPDLSLDVREAWAGLCTATPDRDPLVGAVREGLYVATGFQGQGFMRSPAIGRRVADQMLGDEGIPAFDPTRFGGDEPFDVRPGMAIEP